MTANFPRNVWSLAILDLAVIAAGLFLWEFVFETRHDVILSFTIIAAALVVFFGTLSLGQKLGADWDPGHSSLRNAIAITVVVTYLFLLATYVFLDPPDEQNDLTQALVSNFTAIAGTVIAFYFGASAYVQVKQLEHEKRQSGAKADSDGATA